MERSSTYRTKRQSRELGKAPATEITSPSDPTQAKCYMQRNNTVHCDDLIYQDADVWKDQKDHVDHLIERYKAQLDNLKEIRKHLKEIRPTKSYNNGGPNYHIGYLDSTGQCQCDQGYLSDMDIERRNRLLSRLMSNYTDSANINFSEFTDDIFSRHGSMRERKQRLKNLKKKLMRLHKKDKLCQKTSSDCINTNWDSLMGYIRQNRKRFKHPNCWRSGYECNVMDNYHWATPPYWRLGAFCFCSNSNNNTYWCLRTLNSTHNFVYCEFITKFISYYNLANDPYQLQNAVHELNYGVLQQLHEQLYTMRRCKGANQCNLLLHEKSKKKMGKFKPRQDGNRRSSKRHNRRSWRSKKSRHNG